MISRLVPLLLALAIHLHPGALAAQAKAKAQAAAANPPTEKITYKTVDDKPLQLWIWKPADWKATDTRSAIVFYHGGGWRKGSPTAFSRQSAKLAEQGMVAISVQYRLTEQPGVRMPDCVKDARSAFRYVRAHAKELGINPTKIAAGGGSAGGHLAATLTTIDLNDEKDDLTVSTTPTALVLFNPAANLDFGRAKALTGERFEEMLKLSPYHHLKAGHPPVIIFHGDADTTVPIDTMRAYTTKLTELGVECELISFAGQTHSFFNRDPFIWDTLKQTEAFLKKHHLLGAIASPNPAP